MSNRLVTDRFSRWFVGAILLWLTGTLTASLLVGIALADPMAILLGLPVVALFAFMG